MNPSTNPLGQRIASLAGNLNTPTNPTSEDEIERKRYGAVKLYQPRHVADQIGEKRVFDFSMIPDSLAARIPRARYDNRIAFRPGRLEELNSPGYEHYVFFHIPFRVTLSDLQAEFPDKFLDISGLKKGGDANPTPSDRYAPWSWNVVRRVVRPVETKSYILSLQAALYCHLVFQDVIGSHLFSSAFIRCFDKQGSPTMVSIDKDRNISIPKSFGYIGQGMHAECTPLKRF